MSILAGAIWLGLTELRRFWRNSDIESNREEPQWVTSPIYESRAERATDRRAIENSPPFEMTQYHAPPAYRPPSNLILETSV
jgi:hypothetical protein